MDLIMYHRDCPDGFCAAFIAKSVYQEATLVGLTHGEPPPIISEGMEVLMVDFSYSRDVMLELRKKASGSLFVLDHHATAQKELEGLSFAKFDMKRSGAGMTWDELVAAPRPWWVNYVEDRDLWNNRLPKTEAVNAYIITLPHTVEAWSELRYITWQEAAEKGAAIRMYIDHYIEKILPQHQIGKFFGHTCAVLNMPYMNVSEALDALIKKEHVEIGLAYFERGDGKMQFSLRSVGDVDVSAMAKEYGGGGHVHAAGFDLPHDMGRHVVDQALQRLTGKRYLFDPNSRGQADLDRGKQ